MEPTYYSSLAPFRELFRTGLPILTYHKLGPRPRGARLKGLYLSANLFKSQLAELKAAGFGSSSLNSACASPSPLNGERAGVRGEKDRIVITFDDGFHNVLEHGLAPLGDHNFQAIQFIVADRIGRRNEWDLASGEIAEPLMDQPQIREWLAAGHEIGSHSLTHPFLTRISPDQAREEITASKKKLEDLFGLEIRHFCYPYGDWNPAIRDLVQSAGYQTACTTDFGINMPDESPFSLKRITARYPSRNWKAVKRWCAQWLSKK